jgi:hypothetical protein
MTMPNVSLLMMLVSESNAFGPKILIWHFPSRETEIILKFDLVIS